MLEYPVKAFHDHLILCKDGTVWAYYRIQGDHVSVVDSDKKEQEKIAIQHILADLKKYKDVDLFLIPRDMTLQERLLQYGNEFLPHAKEVGLHYIQQTVERLESEMGQVYVYDWVIGVSISHIQHKESFKESFKHYSNQAMVQMIDSFGYEVELEKPWYEVYETQQQEATECFQKHNGEPLSEAEMMYLNRFHFIRSMPHTMNSEATNTTIENITDCVLDTVSRAGMIQLSSYEGESVVAFLPLHETMLNMSNNHLAEMVQQLPFPIELRYKVRFESVKGTLGMNGKVQRLKDRVKNIVSEALDAGSTVGQRLKENLVLIDDLETKVETGSDIVSWLCTAVISGQDVEEVKRRVDAFLSEMKQLQFHFVRAGADQLYLFDKLLMGRALELSDRNWIQTTTVETFSEMLLFTHQRIGNRIGFYLGRVDPSIYLAPDRESAVLSSQNIVLYNLLVANKGIRGAKTDSPHVSISGETGKGKSYLMKYMWMMSTFTAKTIYFDPKQEVKRWFNKVLDRSEMWQAYPLLMNHIQQFHYITIDSTDKRNWGVLDPIVFLKGTQAKMIAEAMIEMIYQPSESVDAIKTALLKAIRVVIDERAEGKQVGLRKVIDLLRLHDDKVIRDTGDYLEELISHSILELAFSDGTVDGLDLNATTTVIEVLGLQLPKADEQVEDYSPMERASVALMFSLSSFFEKFGSDHPEEDTVIYFDEAYTISNSKMGKRIIKNIRRQGRSMNNVLVSGSQLIEDSESEDDHGQFGTLFVFDEPTERETILKRLGLNVTDTTKNWLKNLLKGQCLYQDMYGRLGKITIDCPFPEMDELFKTVEKTKTSELEEQYV